MRRDIAAFRVSAGHFRKLETRKVSRKVANLASENLLTRDQDCEVFPVGEQPALDGVRRESSAAPYSKLFRG
jgi:hypothetical protein